MYPVNLRPYPLKSTGDGRKARTNGGGLVEVGGGQLGGGVHASPAPEHDALETGVGVQALLRLLVGLLVVAVLGLGALRLVDGQVAACKSTRLHGFVISLRPRALLMGRKPPAQDVER